MKKVPDYKMERIRTIIKDATVFGKDQEENELLGKVKTIVFKALQEYNNALDEANQ